MEWWAVFGGAIVLFLVFAMYACCVAGGDADRRAEAMWAATVRGEVASPREPDPMERDVAVIVSGLRHCAVDHCSECPIDNCMTCLCNSMYSEAANLIERQAKEIAEARGIIEDARRDFQTVIRNGVYCEICMINELRNTDPNVECRAESYEGGCCPFAWRGDVPGARRELHEQRHTIQEPERLPGSDSARRAFIGEKGTGRERAACRALH